MRLGRPRANRVNVTAFAEKRKPDSTRRGLASGNRVEQAVLSLGVLTRHGENGFENPARGEEGFTLPCPRG